MQLPEDSPLKEPISTIQESGNKAAVIVQDLLTLARRGVATRELMNLNDIISKYLKSPEYKKLLSFHPLVKLNTDLGEDLFNISCSPVHVTKTVMNLVSNAAEAISGGGTISISTENRYIDSPIKGYDDKKEGDYITLKVSDNGIGISSKDRERIFEPFYTKKVMGRSGTGLGMTVVWGTVKDHQGYIDVQSTKGKGTTFTLYLPATREKSTTNQAAFCIEEYMSQEASILVVDDVEEQRKIASNILSELGYSVTSVSSGEKAVEYLQDNSVDLLVLDMIMDPGINGLETYKRIIQFHPNQRAIIVSGFSETDCVKEAQKLGAGQYVQKPYSLEKLGVAIKEELEK
jgi:CheY-like chemotaxis protein